MKLHRFFAGDLHDKNGPVELRHHVWVNEHNLINQWVRVLRYKVGDELVLFNGRQEDRLYRIHKIEPTAVGLELITELDPKLPSRNVYLFWSLLKKDKNDWVLQKCTELGVSNFIPLLAERSEKTGFDEVRARRIVIEAAEQCERSDIPHIREPLTVSEALGEYTGKIQLYYCELSEEPASIEPTDHLGVFIGPEGGWTDEELQLFKHHKLDQLHLGQLTLRAETAAVSATTKLLV